MLHMKDLDIAKKNSLEKTGTKKRMPSHVMGFRKSTFIVVSFDVGGGLL